MGPFLSLFSESRLILWVILLCVWTELIFTLGLVLLPFLFANRLRSPFKELGLELATSTALGIDRILCIRASIPSQSFSDGIFASIKNLEFYTSFRLSLIKLVQRLFTFFKF